MDGFILVLFFVKTFNLGGSLLWLYYIMQGKTEEI